MKFSRTIRKVGNSLALIIPPDLAKFLALEENTDVEIQDDEGKFGKFISFWRADQRCRKQ